MAITDILIYLDESTPCESRIDAALTLAKVHGARVTGLFVHSFGFYQPHYLRTGKAAESIEAMLESRADAVGVKARCRIVESGVVGVGVRELLIREAHLSDLLVIGQEPHRTPRSAALVEHLVAGCGRPVLTIPSAGIFSSIGNRVLIAWRDGREATRAMHDALPVLNRAELVTLVAVASAEEPETSSWGPLLEHLGQHGIAPQTAILPHSTATPADNLLNYACDGGYDLLVMGACSPAGTRSGKQLGAVAGQILREMTLPVFMSH